MSLDRLIANRDKAMAKIEASQTPHERVRWQGRYRKALYKLKKYDDQQKEKP
jgi:hypothetical protein